MMSEDLRTADARCNCRPRQNMLRGRAARSSAHLYRPAVSSGGLGRGRGHMEAEAHCFESLWLV